MKTFISFHLDDPRLGRIDYYVTEKGLDLDKPILFKVSGVRGLPVMLVVRSGDQSLHIGTIPPDQISHFADRYHVAFISKPGTPFCDTFEVEEINPLQNLEDYPPSEEYIRKCGMDAAAGTITHREEVLKIISDWIVRN